MSVILLVPPYMQELHQQGALERAFHDGLYPNLAYRAEALAEVVQANTGETLNQSRPGLLPPKTKPLVPGQDPQPSTVIYEQWTSVIQQYADTVDTNMPTSVTAAASLLMRNITQLGLGAGQTINRVARDALFQAYLSGNTVINVATASTDTQLHVSSVNGFTDVVVPGVNVAPKPVSAASPLSATLGIGSAAITVSVVGVVLDDPTDPVGPGTLLLAAAVGAIFAARSSLKSTYAPRIIRSGGGATVDAIGAADTITLQDCINAVALLRRANVQPHEDGYYHAHISPLANAQIFTDTVLQRLNTALPEGAMYSSGFIGHISGIMFFMNTESPDPLNSSNNGPRVFTGPNFAQYSSEIGAETTNDNGIDIDRVIVTGKGALYERYLDESDYVTEAGTTGKLGSFDVINNGIKILTERIRLILRAPLDRLQQVTSSTWSITTCFPVPSDITGPSGPERFKRAVVIEHVL
jgi:hypothetical protein